MNLKINLKLKSGNEMKEVKFFWVMKLFEIGCPAKVFSGWYS
jgi:hypothetical protein